MRKTKTSKRTKSTVAKDRAGSSLQNKTVAILYRPSTKLAIDKAHELAEWLEEQGSTVYSAPGQNLGRNIKSVQTKELEHLNLVVVLGGDGTYLGAVRMLGDHSIPVLGVNMGSLGFLTETRLEDLFNTVTAALSGKMEFRARSMLSVVVRRKGRVRYQGLALNDCVIERGSITHLINMEIHSEKHMVGVVKADALIIATPTGSTAYNLAAGGPILHPEARAIVVTPVCPHALTTRPVIFPDDQKLVFKMIQTDKKAILTVDGARVGDLTLDDEVTVVRNPVDHVTIRKHSHNFFQLLREKLKFGERN